MLFHILSNDKNPTFSLVAMYRVESKELELELDEYNKRESRGRHL